jgi:peptidoglycan/xylan/chitin deacetylase (PgdA/CDA1 family)
VLLIRKMLKRSAEATIAATGMHRFAHRVRRDRAIVLAYHNVVPDELAGSGDSSLQLPLSAFRRQLDTMCRECDPVPLIDLLRDDQGARNGRMPVAITFDDAYRGTLELALPELEERGLPSTIFVAPGLLGDRTLWWDALAEDGEVEPELRSRIFSEGEGTLPRARRIAEADGLTWREMPELLRTSTEPELARAVARGGCTLGSHAWSHASLVHLSHAALQEELARPRDWLRERFGGSYVDVLSYPYGHTSAEVAAAAAASGYQAGLALTRGSLRDAIRTTPFALPRMNVPAGLSANGMRIRLGWQ